MADDKVQQLRAQMHEDAKSGIITLKTPLRAGNIYRITRKQALCLFAMAAGKANEGVDATDIRERLGVEDAQTAVEQAMVFLTTSTPEVKRNS